MRCGWVISFKKSHVRGGSGCLKKKEKKKKKTPTVIYAYTSSNNQIIPSIDSNTRPSHWVFSYPCTPVGLNPEPLVLKVSDKGRSAELYLQRESPEACVWFIGLIALDQLDSSLSGMLASVVSCTLQNWNMCTLMWRWYALVVFAHQILAVF
jgi:hypothetical protein